MTPPARIPRDGLDPLVGRPTRFVLVANFMLFQAAWFAAVLGAAHQWPLLGTTCVGIAIAWHVGTAMRPAQELALVAIVCAVGFAFESAVVAQGHVAYPSGQPVASLAPYWMVALWGLLATAPNVTLRWMKRRPVLAAVLGATFGPLSFVAGVRLGGARLISPVPALLTMACAWALLMPALMWLSMRLDGIVPVAPAPGPDRVPPLG